MMNQNAYVVCSVGWLLLFYWFVWFVVCLVGQCSVQFGLIFVFVWLVGWVSCLIVSLGWVGLGWFDLVCVFVDTDT